MKQSLTDRYLEPHRKYHNLSHINQMFSLSGELNINLTKAQKLAIYYHDAVYNIGSKTNEEDSCEVMLSENPEENRMDLDIAEYIILKTKYHKKTQLKPADIVLDLDMSCFGFEWSKYLSEYSKKVIEEFLQKFTFEEIRKGRTDFLNSLLSDGSIFITDLFKDKYEKIARENIESELKLLSSLEDWDKFSQAQ